MLEPGTVVELALPGTEALIQASVLSCSSTMLSVRLQELGSEAVHRVSLKKLPYKVVRLPGEAAAAGGDEEIPQQDGSSDQEEEEQQQQQSGGSSGEEDDGEEESGSGSEGSDEEGASGDDDDAAAEGEPAALDAFSPATAAAVEAFAAAMEADPAALLQPTEELAALAKTAAKALYDYQAASGAADAAASGKSGKSGKSGGAAAAAAAAAAALPELYIEGFDAEQIWLQLELAAAPALKRARKLLKRAGQEPVLLTPEMEEAVDELLEGGSGGDSEGYSGSEGELSGSEDEEGSEEEDDDEEEGGALDGIDYDALLAAGAAQQRRRQQAAGGSSDEDEEGGGGGAAQLAGSKRKRASGKGASARAAVEDEHFNLDEMEAFVQQAEREEAGLEDEEGGEAGAGSDDEEAQLEALLDQAAAQDKKKGGKKKKRRGAFGEDDYEEEGDDEGAGATAMFADFFGPGPGSGRQAAGGRRQQLEDMGDDMFMGGEGEEEGEEEEDESEDEDADEGFEDDLLSDDLLSGEEDGEGGAAGRRRGGEDSEEEEEEEGSEGEDGWGQRNLLAESDEDDEEGSEEDEELAPSAHQLRQERMAERIQRLEAAAMGDKDWFMRGEVDAARRPKNSALEVDLDFETTVKPPPQPTEELTASLDDLIKKRIIEGRWDDPIRVALAAPQKTRTEVQLDDRKPQQGLGELYEAEYMAAVTGAVDDKDEEVRQSARAQFSALCAKLDALSHLHFTPRPVIEEVAVKVDVPAIMMEEAAPQYVSGASMAAPEEVFGSEARGAPRAEEELEREERKQRRAQKKRAGRKRRASKEEERAARAVTQGGTAPLAGRKSEAAEKEARKMAKAAKRGASSGGKRSEFGKSAKVFSMIQQHVSGASAEAAAEAAAKAAPKASHLKL